MNSTRDRSHKGQRNVYSTQSSRWENIDEVIGARDSQESLSS